MAARHLSPGAPEPAPARSTTVWWILGVLVVVVAVLIVVGLRAAAEPGGGTGAVGGADTRPPVAGSAPGTAAASSAASSSASVDAGTSREHSRSPSATSPSPSATEDAAAVRQAETLKADSERRLGSTPWKLTSVLRGRSCSLSGGRTGLQSEWTDEGPASTAPATDLATLESYWRGLGLATRRATVSDPTGTFAAVQADGGPVSSIRYVVSGAITTVSVCRSPH